MISPKVRILKRNQLDDVKWNSTISEAVNSLPYGYTWYMDALCTKWIGLVVGDYDYVMPLALGRKWGLRYVYQPLFCQQLGVFYKKHNEPIIELMIKAALSKFIFVNLNLNYDNGIKIPVKGLSKKKNLVIPLSGSHNLSREKYADNTLRNIKKGQKAELVFESENKKGVEKFADFYVSHTAIKDTNFKPRHIESLKRLVHQFIIHDLGKLYVAKNNKGDICAGVIVVETPTRIIHLLPAADDYARQNGGMHFLVDAVLEQYANSKKVYDFEGSSVDSIARFYESFGAVKEAFFVLSKSPFKATKLSKGNR